ncbi:hypothetical protein FRC18_000711 [Serendipita sp. 400]|nr:hypothetical protein FRC18_000711 [Serendipita sp. 400]
MTAVAVPSLFFPSVLTLSSTSSSPSLPTTDSLYIHIDDKYYSEIGSTTCKEVSSSAEPATRTDNCIGAGASAGTHQKHSTPPLCISTSTALPSSLSAPVFLPPLPLFALDRSRHLARPTPIYLSSPSFFSTPQQKFSFFS